MEGWDGRGVYLVVEARVVCKGRDLAQGEGLGF